jgi:hypothetical protein
MKQKLTLLLLLLFSLTAFSQNANVCFNRLHHGYAEMLIPVNQWQGTSVTLKVYHPNNNLVVSPVIYNTAELAKVSNASGQQYYYLKGLNNVYANETLTYEVSSPQDAAVSNTLAALPENQWSAAGTADVCGINKADVCFNRLHHGYAELLIPVSQWQGTSVTLKVYHPNNNLVVSPVTYNTAELTKVTNAAGQQYYYLKGLNNVYANETLTYEVSSPQDAAVSNTLAALPQSEWSAAGTADVCGINKADVCFHRLHHGYAELLIPVNQWQGTSVTLKVYHPNNNLVASPVTYNTAELTKVTNATGQQYYYLKGLNNVYANETLTYEVSSPQDAAVSNTLAALTQSEWSAAGSADVCGINKADVCFNRLHHGYAEMLIPVSQWQGTSVTLKVYHPNNNLVVSPVTYNTAELTKVTNATGQQYYYLKGLNNVYANETLTYEVSSPQDAAVSNTLAALPENQWSAAGTADVCGINKADVCFNRLHHGYAEMLIPVNQWQGTSVTLKVYHPNNNLVASPVTYNTADLTKVTNATGQQYYYLKGINNVYANETLTYEVSSPQDAAVSNTLATLPVSDWNDFTKQENCINKADRICINRNNAVYNIFIPVNQWTGTDIRVKLYHSNGTLIADQLFSNPATENHNGILCYKIAANFPQYANENLIVEVSSISNAAVHMYLNPVQELCYGNSACTNPVTPSFTQIAPVCSGAAFSLPAVSNNGITGSWSPAINNTATTAYTFTPDAGQCANGATMTVTVNPVVTPDFAQIAPVCAGGSFTLPAASDNGINGTWSPAVNNQATTTYIFTPDAGQCANTVAMTVQVNPVITPAFAQVQAISPGEQFTLSTTSNEGITGTWSPAINNQATTTYTFTPAAGQCANTVAMTVSVVNWKLAPNSYVFDPNQQQYDGLYIPVKKAFAMWSDNSSAELSLNNPIPAGSTISAYVYWEDVTGLVKTANNNYNLEIIGSGSNAKIKVLIDKAKGKGNALVTLHAGPNGNNTDPVYWSWHVWVTDDAAIDGSTFRQGYETDKNNVPFNQVTNRDGSLYKFQWMNRNLGATNAEFLGNDWNKSAGLMYQWGRKDPIPPLLYKDATGYEINGAAGTFKVQDFVRDSPSPFGWTMRPYNIPNSHSDVSQNIGYSIKNPLKAITFSERYGHWFSDQPYKVAGDTYTTENWDLWSDNRKGLWSHYYTSNASVAADTKSYELKSAYDPCPCGWRIPSHYGSVIPYSISNGASPWGRRGSGADDDANDNSKFYLGSVNPVLDKVKVYPSLGFDFRQQNNANDRNIGIFPINGAYVFMGPNEVSDYYSATPRLGYINWLSTAGAPTATLVGGANNAAVRGFGFVSDFYKYPTESKYRISVNQYSPAKGAGTVRCMSDPNEKYLGNFATEFIPSAGNADDIATLKSWTKDPNSYIVMTNAVTEKKINLRKAYAMYKLYLSDDEQFPQGQPSVSVYWTTNSGLINNISMNGSAIGLSEMNVVLNQGQTGNAVVALHVGNTGTSADPVIWSWHLWAPETMPAPIPVYKTENAYQSNPSSGQIINPTNNLISPPLETEFMDRNLGALIPFPTVSTSTIDADLYKKSIGLHYQWGRKDPIPTFLDQTTITGNNGAITSNQYNSNYTKLFSVYGSQIAGSNDKRSIKISKILKYSIENPLTYLYNDLSSAEPKDWISNGPGLASERWGHATEKSPFDPCPDGWRIPDVSFSFLNQAYAQVSNGVKGTSPWYFGKVADPLRTDGVMGIDQRWETGGTNPNPIIANSASGVYNGRYISSTVTNTGGWIFDNPNYSIGNYPVTGIRGETGVDVSINFPRVGVWTGALGDYMIGNATGLSIRYSKMATGYSSYSPHEAMSCRCAKIQYDTAGKEIGRYDPNAIPVPQNATGKAANTFAKTEIKQMIKEDKLILFPNPVKDIVFIDAKDSKEYYYQIYSMSGQMVKAGKFVNKQTNIATLPAGAYLARINNSESVVKIIKQ